MRGRELTVGLSLGLLIASLLAACGPGVTRVPHHRASPSSRVPSPSSALPSPTPAPAGFLAASVTFVSALNGWALGTAPCADSTCLAVVRTQDGGQLWSAATAPPTSYSSGPLAGGVNGIRFANVRDGWAFGSQLWATHDGGLSWAQISILGWAGAAVEQLDTAAGTATAVFLDTAKSGNVGIASSPVGSNSWQVSLTLVSLGAGPVPAPDLVLQGSAGWVLENDRTVVGGARLAVDRWASWQPPCTEVNGPASLAASSPQDLLAVCDQGVWGPVTPSGVRLWVSSNGGDSFAMVPTPLPSAAGGPLASPSATVAAVGDGSDILATFNGGVSWDTVYAGSEGIQYLGFTTSSRGVAITGGANGGPGSLLMTTDGGHHWAPVAI